MEHLQQQISELSQQVSSLSKTIEEIPQLLKGMSDIPVPSHSNYQISYLDRLEHKDILTDKGHSYGHEQLEEKDISSEWQVRRLTAQLTIAYNRIAELEEELLSRRIAFCTRSTNITPFR
jgi:chaperonin cofactor prefoldin